MENNNNRVINDLSGWQQMESKWKELLGPQIVNQRYFMLERYKSLKDIPKNYKGQARTMSAEEKSALKIVKGEINRMEKFLYKSALVRSVVKIIDMAKELNNRIRSQRTDEVKWKPSIGTIKEHDKQQTFRTEKDKDMANEVAHNREQSMGPKKDNKGPSRDIRKNERIDEGPLLVKLKTNGTAKGIKH